MPHYQKFMFDNFVIACEDEKASSSDNAGPVAEVADTQTPEPAPEVISGEEPEKTETVAEPEPELDPEPVPEPEPVPPPAATFSQDELDAAIKQAEERGYENGFRAAFGDFEKQRLDLLQEMNKRLQELFAGEKEQEHQAEREALRAAAAAVKKLFPSLEKKQAKDEVKRFLEENFAGFGKEASLSFSLNPEMAGIAAEIISKLADKNDFEGKIAIHKDAALGMSDCRVEWTNGGVERNSHKTLEKIEDLLDDKSSANKERDNG